ncbi:hypothetical protein SCHPADRAFT_994599 [Schizopora paradoxa]|uniref:Rad9-domain-containing protein n=1 Tax=Schizopora paradoxa TaxID=27342 RepID=A0A0H2RYH8_9AGAM|nr:hypothetical protein SCHPADRAFT_994599 [Schizopora paradoxa]
MQAVLDDKALKPFTKALTCLSKYGENITIRASQDSLSLSSLNSSHSAYCNFKYNRDFFQRYSLSKSNDPGPSASNSSRTPAETAFAWSLNTKALLTILRHRNNDKSAEKCEFIVVEGQQPETQDEAREDEDSLESRLILRLHCKHGVVKTHRLLLNEASDNFVPIKPQNDQENRICVHPRTLKDIIDHFPFSKSAKSDPQLIWRFGDLEVSVQSVDGGIDTKGKTQLATELTISSDDFEEYDVSITPMSVGFHLREFNASVAYADGMSVLMELHLAAPSEPLCIRAATDDCEMQFMISTMQVRGAEDEPRPSAAQQAANRVVSSSNGSVRKRGREEEETPARRKQQIRKSMKVVEKSDGSAANGDVSRSRASVSQRSAASAFPEPEASQQPLFLASQLSTAAVNAIRESGLGLEEMDADEFAAFMDDEGEDVDFNGLPSPSRDRAENNAGGATDERMDSREGSLEYAESDEGRGSLGPTQLQRSPDDGKTFHALFED